MRYYRKQILTAVLRACGTTLPSSVSTVGDPFRSMFMIRANHNSLTVRDPSALPVRIYETWCWKRAFVPILLLFGQGSMSMLSLLSSPQWVTADAEIKDLFVENPELKGSSF